jgi:sRNA-binding regulator protein Hfq
MILPHRARRARRKKQKSDSHWKFRLCVLCGYFLLDALQAGAALQEVVLVDGAAFRGELLSIDADGFMTFRVSGGKEKDGTVRTVALKDLVRWGNPVAPRAQTIVVLADGGRMMTAADWTGGATLKLAGGDVVVVSNMWNDVRLARGLVCGIVFAPQQRAEDREKLAERVRVELSPIEGGDAVLLTNGDRLTGKLTELDHGSVAISTRGGVAKARLSRVEAIIFGNRTPTTMKEPSPRHSLEGRGKLAIGLRDGSLVYANAIRANEKSVDIELASGVKLKGDAADDSLAIQSLDGAVVYLSDLEGADYRGVPYLSVKWPFLRDRNVLGEPIIVRGKRFLKGIGMHSAARLTYQFDENYRRFDSAVAIDDSAKGRGSVTFGVYVLRDGKWGEAFKSGIVRGGEDPKTVSVDLRDAKGLTLTVDFADRGDELDHAVWLDARLVR